jgi:CBS domain-containing protein
MVAKDIMTRDTITIRPGVSLAEAAKLMLKHGLNALPVVDQEHVVGMIGIKDILRAPIPSFYDTLIHKWTRPEEKAALLLEVRVEQVMARNVVSVEEETPVMEVTALMANRGLHPIPVLRESRLIGIIGRADAVRALLDLADAHESSPGEALTQDG